MRNDKTILEKDENIKPCPFCGEKLSEYLEVQVVKTIQQIKTKDYFTVRCIHCGAGGLAAANKENAVKLWNARGKKEHENVFNAVLNEETDGKWGKYLETRGMSKLIMEEKNEV